MEDIFMSQIKVLAIVPYQEMKSSMERLVKERSDMTLTVELGNAQTCADIWNKHSVAGYDAIISRGGTARVLRSTAVLPVIEVSITVYDLLRCLREVQAFKGKLAVVGYPNITECAEQLKSLIQYDLEVCTLTKNSNVKKELIKLREHGVGLIICDRVSKVNAEELGINAVFLSSDDASISAAFDEAVHIARLSRNLKRQSSIMHQLLAVQDFFSFVCDKNGTVVFSNIYMNHALAGFENELNSLLPSLLQGGPTKVEREYNGHFVVLEGVWISSEDQPYYYLRLKVSDRPILSTKESLLQASKVTQLSDEVVKTGSVVYMGSISHSITACFSTMFPVLIIGERGTGKDTVAGIIYRNGPCRKRNLFTVNCNTVTPRQFSALLSHEDSPFMSNGVTIYFRAFDRLSNNQAERLFEFIEQNRVHYRNRLIFSFTTVSERAEQSDVCEYLKNHFSTICLRLPPLRFRHDDIANIVTIYIHQLNRVLGKEITGVDRDAMKLLEKFSWKENFGQLLRVVRTLVQNAKSSFISVDEVTSALAEELPYQPHGLPEGTAVINLRQSLKKINEDVIRLVMDEEKSQTGTAKRLGISRTTIWNMLRD